MKLTKKQIAVLEADGHVIVTGGPGSGKTTISILKAAGIAATKLKAGQKVLFLSFARATVSRVIEAIEHEQKIPDAQKKQIEVDTYHAFFWRILKTHGYLVGLPRRIDLLAPPAEAIALAGIRAEYPAASKITELQKAERQAREETERKRLAFQEGRVCFDLFAALVGDLLVASARVRRVVATMHPFIILDEFQDTNSGQWRVVKELGRDTTLIALADPEQRIYDWIGADPKRLDHFKEAFKITSVDLSTDNHRSAGTDIAAFGNDILAGKWRQQQYVGIDVEVYESGGTAQPMTALIAATYAARKRLVESGRRDWSLAILVPTKRMTRLVSDSFREPPAKMTPIAHVATIEREAAILAAEIIAHLLESDLDGRHFDKLVQLLCNYFQGKGSDDPSKGDMKEAAGIRKAYEESLKRQAQGKAVKANSIIVAVIETYQAARAIGLTGDPDADWRNIRKCLEEGRCPRLKDAAIEVKNIRLLDRGAQLRLDLSQCWRDAGKYAGALEIIRSSFKQEHFAVSGKVETGVLVMNMHKAKGKQFDEVIIFEGWPIIVKRQIVANVDRIVRGNSADNANEQARQNLRVSVTRGKKRTLILTPKADPCVLLLQGSEA
jgi:DNA helicase-2/ATP-dependent DNA helicase PcrA